MGERQIFQLGPDEIDTETLRDRCIDVERLACDAATLVAGHVAKRAHVVQAIREFDKDHAQILRHRQQQLAETLRLHLRSEEHTSELQSLMRISYAVFCLKKKKQLLR